MPKNRYPRTVKTVAGTLASYALPQCRFDRTILIIGHMRCGSTALSNILCSRADVNGQGESHIRYNGRSDLGILALSLANRGVFQWSAPLLFDKLLHDQYDRDAGDDFFRARAIFLAREPAETIPSITRLYDRIGLDDFRSPEKAARYYVQRMASMQGLWDRFAPERRIALTHAALTADPEAALAAISGTLAIAPPLVNRYDPTGTPWRKGGGDPVNAQRYDRIVPELRRPQGSSEIEGIEPDLHAQCINAFARYRQIADRHETVTTLTQ